MTSKNIELLESFRGKLILPASKATNFVYKITSDSLKEDDINSRFLTQEFSKVKNLPSFLKKTSMRFIEIEEQIFYNNLALIDSQLPKMLSLTIIYFYLTRNEKLNQLAFILLHLNPLYIPDTVKYPFYKSKLAQLLKALISGMLPDKAWTGKSNLNKFTEYTDLYEQRQFEDYLLNNTKLETASSSRHEFGDIYEENGELYFKLNLQIRFIK